MKEHAWLNRFRRKRNADEEVSLNPYYEKISAGLGIAQVVLYLALFAFVVLSFLGNTNLITYRNFYYFFKDLNASAETVDVFASDSVSYPTSDEQSFTLYRKGLAIAGNKNVTVFTATGRQTVSQSINYKNPIAVGSGKYLLVYELGGTQYSVYNSYTQLYTGKSDFPILGAAVSDSGMYALISRSEDATSVVLLYNDQFSLLDRYTKNGCVMDVALNGKGNEIAILTSTPIGGRFITELEIFRTRAGEKKRKAAVEIGNSLALSCTFSDTGGLNVLCGNGFTIVNDDGILENFYDFENKTIVSSFLDESGGAFCLKNSAISDEKQIVVLDKNGKILYDETLKDEIDEIVRLDDSIFIKTKVGVTLLDLCDNSSRHVPCRTENCHILAVAKDEVLLCSPQKATFIRF